MLLPRAERGPQSSVFASQAEGRTKGRPSGRHSAKAALSNMLAHRGLVTLGGGPHQRSLAVLVCGGRARSRGEQDAHHLEEGAGAGFGLAAQGMPRGQGRRTVGLGAKGKGMAMGKGMGIRDWSWNSAAERLRVAAARGSVQWPPLELVRGLDVSTLAMTTSRSGGTDFGVGAGSAGEG